MKRVEVVIVVCTLGTINTELPEWLEQIGDNVKIGSLQSTKLLGAAHTTRVYKTTSWRCCSNRIGNTAIWLICTR